MRKFSLTNGTEALLCNCHAHLVDGVNWYDNYNGYVRREVKGKKVYLHRVIMGAAKGQIVDHKNGNTLDNRCTNLQFVSRAENARKQKIISNNNTSGYKGVIRNIKNNNWNAKIMFNYKTIHLGSYSTKEEAAEAYDLKAAELFGKFANLNNVMAVIDGAKP